MAINVGSAVAYLELDISNYTGGFRRALSELKTFQDKTTTAGQKISASLNALSYIGSDLTKNVTVPIVGIGTAAVKVAVDFDKQMSAVRAVSGATESDFESLRQKAIDLGADTAFSASEVAVAMTEMAKAGWSSQQIMEGMQGVLDATAASGEDLATVSTIIADAITTFGLSASESTRVADLLSQAANAGTISVSDLGESLKYIGPVANTMGFSIEDVVTAITAMSQAGIKGSQAGTSLRSMFARLVKPTENVAIAMDQLGIVLTDEQGNFKSMDTILSEMRKTFSQLTPEQQAYYATVLAGQEGMSGLTSLLGMTQEEYDKVSESMKNATGTAEETAKVMQDNLAGAVEQLGGSLESAGIVIGQRLTPKIRKLTNFVDDAVDSFNSLDEEQQDTIVNLGLIAAAVGPVTLAGSKLLKGITTVGKGFVSVTSNISLFVQALSLSKRGMGDVAMQVSPLYAGLKNIISATGLSAAGFAGVTVAVAAGVSAFALYINHLNKVRKEAAELTESEQYLADAIDETYENYTEMSKTVSNAISDTQKEADATQALYNKLQDVVYANGRVKEGKEAYAQFIVGELSNALGQEISIVDGQIQQYEELTSTIQETIDKKRAMAVQEQLGDAYTEALSKQAEAAIEYQNQLQSVSDAQKEYNEIQEEYSKLADRIPDEQEQYNLKLIEMGSALEGAQEKLNKQRDSLSKAEEAMVGYNQTIENYEGLGAAIISGDAEQINQALLRVQEGFLTANTATREALEEQSDTLKEKYEEMSEALAEGAPGVTQQAVDNIKALMDQSNAELTARIEQDKQTLIQQYNEMGIQAPQALIDRMVEQDPVVQQTVVSMFDQMKNGTQLKKDEITQLFTSLGVEAPSSLISQLTGLEPSVQQSAISLLTQLQYAEQSKRPEIVAQLQALGISMDDSIAGGLQSNKSTVTSSASDVGQAGNKAVEDELKKEVDSPDVSSNTTARAQEEARKARNAMQIEFDSNPIVAVVNVVRKVAGAVSDLLDGSHANGLAYVPFDGYIAELHKGERVLTAQENQEYNKGRLGGGSGDTYIFYNTKPDPYEYSRQIRKVKQELARG